jgi:hypothetical protein
MSHVNKYNFIGYSIVAIGIFFNEYTIKHLLHWGGQFNSITKSVLFAIIDISIILIGVFIMRQKKQAIIKLIISFLSITLLFVFMECLLSLNTFDNLSSEKPIWIPAKYKNISKEFNKLHNDKSKFNEFGFNDVNHSKQKKSKSVFRVAILGDSFIWGAGVPDSVIWTNKLAVRLEKEGINNEILNWGKSGWSTLDEYNFLISTGFNYQFDFLIFATVVNDPVMDSSNHVDLITRYGFFEQSILGPMSIIFPNTVYFTIDILNNFCSIYPPFGYMNWLKRIYSDNNLSRYSTLIGEIKHYCDSKNIKCVFILTPENHNIVLENYFNKIIPILKTHSVAYLDLFPAVSKDLGHYSNRSLWANPADGHPGNMVTDVYSDQIFKYLKSELPNYALKLTK